MKTNNKKGMLKTLLSAAVLLAATSCSDWTEVESIELQTPSLETQNPELYAQYLKSLVDFKNSDHQVVIASFNNVASATSSRSQHLTDLPDSLDYICLNNVVEVNQVNKDEMIEVRKKGTKVVGLVDFDQIDAAWKAILDAEANAESQQPAAESPETGEGEGEVVVDPATRFIEYCKAETTKMIEACNVLGVDGIEINYSGADLNSLVDEAAIAAETARQGAFFDVVAAWKVENADKVLLFKGCPQNVMVKSILNECKYIIVAAHAAKNQNEFSYNTFMACTKDVPTDRFVIGVTTPYETASGTINGEFGDGSSAIVGAAMWVLPSSAEFTKAGISIDNVEKDYFNVVQVYPAVKQAINIISPTVK